MAKKKKPKRIDWEAVEPDYRAGVMTMREIAQKHGIAQASTVSKYANRHGWTRDLTGKVQRETRSRLSRGPGHADGHEEDPRVQKLKDEHAVEVAVQTNLEVIRSHRARLQRMNDLAGDLLDKLEVKAAHEDTLADVISDLTANDKSSTRYTALMKLLGVQSDASTLESLTRTTQAIVKLERQAFGILDEPEDDQKSYEDRLAELHSAFGEPGSGRIIDGDFSRVDDAAEAGQS